MRKILIGVAIACVIAAGALAWHAKTTSDDARSVRDQATRVEHDTNTLNAKSASERRQSDAIAKRTSDAYNAMSDVDRETADVSAAVNKITDEGNKAIDAVNAAINGRLSNSAARAQVDAVTGELQTLPDQARSRLLAKLAASVARLQAGAK
jgi:hypothetical protein